MGTAIEHTSAATILAETGADMAQFPSEKHFVRGPACVPATTRMRVSARASERRAGRVKTKHGGEKPPAIMAVAYVLLMLGIPYQERGAPLMTEQKCNRLIPHHIRWPGKLGIAPVSLPKRPRHERQVVRLNKNEGPGRVSCS